GGAAAATICFTEPSGRFLPAVKRRISIRTADRFPFCGTRVCAAESQPINPAGLFSAMDAAEGSRLQSPIGKFQKGLTTDDADSTDEKHAFIGAIGVIRGLMTLES